MTPREFARMLPAPPDYQRDAVEWCSLRMLAGMLGVSDTGLVEIRQTLGNPFEHRDRRGHVFIYAPFWFRAWILYEEQHGRGRYYQERNRSWAY